MMRPHCDRCDALCDEHLTWVGEGKHIWHLVIHAGGQVPCEENMFCRKCRITILEAHVAALRLVKGTGEHLADCWWNALGKRYECVDGCEIKRINELP